MNVFHAGDGNLHPLLVFDAREPGVLERVHAAGEEIVQASLAAGGVLSGEHGIGLEKRDFMALLFSRRRPRRPGAAARGVRPRRRRQPAARCCPAGSRCGDLQARARRGCGCDVEAPDRPRRVRRRGRRRPDPWSSRRRPDAVGRRRAGRPGAREVRAPAGIVEIEPAEMTVRVRAGTTVAELDAALGGAGQCVALPVRGRRDGRRRARRRAQRAAPPRVGPGARHGARGRGTCRPRAARQGRRADGEERERLRPVPAARRLARHARAPRRGVLRTRPLPAVRALVHRRATHPSALVAARTGRRRSCGTARRRGCCSRATPTDVDAEARGIAGLVEADGLAAAAAAAPLVAAARRARRRCR